MENGYLTDDYPIERWLSWERSGQKNRRDMCGRIGVSDSDSVSAVRRTCYREIKPGGCLVKPCRRERNGRNMKEEK